MGLPFFGAFGGGAIVAAATITPDPANTAQVCENQVFVAMLTGAVAATYLWSLDGLVAGQGTATATYNWDTTCDHVVTVIVTTAGGSSYTATYTPVLTLSLMQICDAIETTISPQMTPALMTRSYGYDDIPEGINDAPSLMVYWQSVVCDVTTQNDRLTFGGGIKNPVRVKEMVFYVDYIANPRNNLAQNNAQLTRGASEIIDILETEALACTLHHCPPFSLCALKTFRWSGERVTFDYGGVVYYGARFQITIRVW